MASGECSAKFAEHSPASTLSGRRALWSRCSASAGQLGPGCRRVSKSMRRRARRAGSEQRRPGPGRLLATLRRPRCSNVVAWCVRWRRSGARTRGSMKCPSTLPTSMPSVWCIRHRTKHPGNATCCARAPRRWLSFNAPDGCRSNPWRPCSSKECGRGRPGHDREVVTSQFGHVGKQSASTPSTLSEATGNLPYGSGQPVTSPSVLRAG